MGHSGINVLFEGRNFTRLLGGLWTSVWIAVLSLIIGLALVELKLLHTQSLRQIDIHLNGSTNQSNLMLY